MNMPENHPVFRGGRGRPRWWAPGCHTARVGLFSKKRSVPDASGLPITAFWEWWAHEGRTLDPHQPSAATDELARRVAAVHPDLVWNFGPGTTAEVRLTVSAGGVAQVRPSAERWLRAAPAADATWEYRASQEPEPGAMSSRLSIAGHDVDLSLTRFRVDPVEEELRVHVGVYHPAFARLPDGVRGQVTFLVLDWVLGEDDVERWVGHVEPLVAAPPTPVTAEDLTAAVRALARSVDPDDWTLATWQAEDGRPGMASFRRGVRWIDHPTFDRHHVLVAGFAAQANGLPSDGSVLDELRYLEQLLEDGVGPRGLLVGHETHAGSRTFHVYTDGEDQNADEALRELAAGHGMRLTSRLDPAWSEVRHFTG